MKKKKIKIFILTSFILLYSSCAMLADFGLMLAFGPEALDTPEGRQLVESTRRAAEAGSALFGLGAEAAASAINENAPGLARGIRGIVEVNNQLNEAHRRVSGQEQGFHGVGDTDDSEHARPEMPRYFITFINDTDFSIPIRGHGVRMTHDRTGWDLIPAGDYGLILNVLIPRSLFGPFEMTIGTNNPDMRWDSYIFPSNFNNPDFNHVYTQDMGSRRVMLQDRRELFGFYLDEEDMGPLDEVFISIPRGITSIGDREFADMQLTNVTISDSVTSIGNWAFSGNQLANITIPGSVTLIEAGAFSRNQLTNVTIPYGVISIGSWAFALNQLVSITIRDSVVYIGNYAFISNQLTDVTIPDNVTSIGNWAFAMNRLTSITIGAGVMLGENAFDAGFEKFYESNGRRAGTYTLNDGDWIFQPR